MAGINNLVFMTSGNWGLRTNYVSMPRAVFSKCGPGPGALASPENLLEMQITGLPSKTY